MALMPPITISLKCLKELGIKILLMLSGRQQVIVYHWHCPAWRHHQSQTLMSFVYMYIGDDHAATSEVDVLPVRPHPSVTHPPPLDS